MDVSDQIKALLSTPEFQACMVRSSVEALNRFREENEPKNKQLAYTPTEVQELLGISRSVYYKMDKAGNFEFVTIGNKQKITTSCLRKLYPALF